MKYNIESEKCRGHQSVLFFWSNRICKSHLKTPSSFQSEDSDTQTILLHPWFKITERQAHVKSKCLRLGVAQLQLQLQQRLAFVATFLVCQSVNHFGPDLNI